MTEAFTIQPPVPASINFVGHDGKTAVTIRPGGQVEIGEGFTGDEASRLFWDRLLQFAPWVKP